MTRFLLIITATLCASVASAGEGEGCACTHGDDKPAVEAKACTGCVGDKATAKAGDKAKDTAKPAADGKVAAAGCAHCAAGEKDAKAKTDAKPVADKEG